MNTLQFFNECHGTNYDTIEQAQEHFKGFSTEQMDSFCTKIAYDQSLTDPRSKLWFMHYRNQSIGLVVVSMKRGT